MMVIDNKSDWLSQQAKLSPDCKAVLAQNFTLTYNQLHQKVISTSLELQAKGIIPNSHVALLFDNSPEFIICVLALWKSGAVPVPLNPRLTAVEIEKLFDLSALSFMLIQNSLKDRFEFSQKINCLSFSFKEENNNKSETSFDFRPDNIALLMFTSGTTGEPKGVMLTFDNLFHNAQGVDSIVDHQTKDRWLASLPFYHIGGFSIITRALLTGASIVFPDSLKIESISAALVDYNPTLASFVPTTLRQLIDNKATPHKLRNIFLGGGPIEKQLIAEAIAADWPIAKVYGSTETSSMIAALTFDELKQNIELGAKPISDNRIFVLDAKGNKLKANESGQIVVASKSIMKGYFNDDAATKMVLRDDYFLTSDFGHVDEDGYLYIEGRIDDIIISGGENINPKEIEDALLKHPDVADAVVFKMKDEKWGEVPYAAVNIRLSMINNASFAGTHPDKQLKEYLRQSLSAFKIPKKIFIVPRIPRNEMGKVNKDKLKEMLGLR